MPAKPMDKSSSPPNGKLWVVFGDIHDDLENIAKIPELSIADAIIISGDLTNCGGAAKAQRVMDAISSAGAPVYAQIGNMDKGEINSWLNGLGRNLHGRVIELAPDVAVFGAGGSTPTPMNTCSEFPEEDYANWLAEEWQKAGMYQHSLLVSHNPPKDTLCDAINPSLHVGSTAVRAFIEREQPEICICGHIHEGRGVDRIGRSVIINPGTLASGGYVIVRMIGDKLVADLRDVANPSVCGLTEPA